MNRDFPCECKMVTSTQFSELSSCLLFLKNNQLRIILMLKRQASGYPESLTLRGSGLSYCSRLFTTNLDVQGFLRLREEPHDILEPLHLERRGHSGKHRAKGAVSWHPGPRGTPSMGGRNAAIPPWFHKG